MPEAIPDIAPEGDDFLVMGQNSYLNPEKIPLGGYVEGMNVMCRGGYVQTRPGSASVFTLPDGLLQGCTMFTPANGVPHLVFAVSGKVYVSAFPFNTYAQLGNIQFSLNSTQIAWCSCLKSSDYTDDGQLYYIENPYSVLVMQDGLTRAAYWDGATNGHLNPNQSPVIDPESGEVITQPGYDETPLGLWMVWSNNRLWVSRGNQVFASDIGNPLKFTETGYLNEARAFYLPGPCTGMIEATDQQGVLAFTKYSGVFINSAQQDRSTWTNGSVIMQKTIIPNIGCAAPRSLISQYGMIWWYSSKGLINLDDALRLNITSRLDVRDNEMYSTKHNVSYDLSGVCSTYYENMLLCSVPNGDSKNTSTMVLDQAPFNNNTNTWASHWEGWRPVEWARGVISGDERLFFASVDYDGKNRIWESMLPDRTDNGTPITCYVITRQHLFQSRDYKTFKYTELDLRNIEGEVSVMICAKGMKGGFQKIGGAEITSQIGQMYGDASYGSGSNGLNSSSQQSRVVRSEDGANPSECNSVCIESNNYGLIDKSFGIMIAWSGKMALTAYRIFVQSTPTAYTGTCNPNESGPRLINQYGCGAMSRFSTGFPFETYTATSTYSKVNQETGKQLTYTAVAYSVISQQDADRKATSMAVQYINTQLGYT